MSPDRLIDWAISIAVCIVILRFAGVFGARRSKEELEEKIASLENRIEKLEKTKAA